MSTELMNALLVAELGNLDLQLAEAEIGLEDALRDLAYAREEIQRISSGENAVILLRAGILEERFNQLFEMKREAKKTIKYLTPIVAELETKIQKAEAAKAACELALTLETCA
jgi:hypothetical protein